jgi:DMSO/TMAO reductase YedYZ molybdopterin-dependent catalytic subunit
MRLTKMQWRYGAVATCALIAAISAHPILGSDVAAGGEKAARANSISIEGAVEHPGSLTLADLQREAATTEAVSLKTGRGVLTGKFTGVLLWTLLQRAVIRVSPEIRNDVMRHTILVTSSDGYTTVLSAAEIDPEFGGERAIVAYAKDGQLLTDKRGFARLIFPADQSAGRAISGVSSIIVR